MYARAPSRVKGKPALCFAFRLDYVTSDDITEAESGCVSVCLSVWLFLPLCLASCFLLVDLITAGLCRMCGYNSQFLILLGGKVTIPQQPDAS